MRKVGAIIALLLVLGGWFTIAHRQTLYSLFPALKPANRRRYRVGRRLRSVR
jgi:hypothetical protein